MFIYQKNKLIIKDLKKIILLKDTQIIVKTNQHNIIIKGNELTLGYFECFEVHILGLIKEISINENKY